MTQEAMDDISAGTRALIREEIRSAQHEMMGRARAALPSVGMLGVAAAFGVFSAAAAFRWAMRLFDKAAPPATAAMLASMTFGAAAVGAGAIGVRWLRQAPTIAPTDTMHRLGERAGQVAGQQ